MRSLTLTAFALHNGACKQDDSALYNLKKTHQLYGNLPLLFKLPSICRPKKYQESEYKARFTESIRLLGKFSTQCEPKVTSETN